MTFLFLFKMSWHDVVQTKLSVAVLPSSATTTTTTAGPLSQFPGCSVSPQVQSKVWQLRPREPHLASNRWRAAAWGPSPKHSTLNKSISVWKLWRRPLNSMPLGWLWGRTIWDVSRRNISNMASGEIALNYIWIQPHPPQVQLIVFFFPLIHLMWIQGRKKRRYNVIVLWEREGALREAL